jgi:hypothetical protein
MVRFFYIESKSIGGRKPLSIYYCTKVDVKSFVTSLWNYNHDKGKRSYRYNIYTKMAINVDKKAKLRKRVLDWVI